MFAVVEKMLLSDYGKSCVRQYKDTSDAKSVYHDLFEQMEKSTKTSLESSLLSYITSAALAMVLGMDLPTVSNYTGRTKSDFTRNLSLLRNISVLS
jgi:hypothetical protein